MKLGNTDIGAEAEGMSYTFTVPVTEDTFTITYFYAVVFENPNHSPPEHTAKPGIFTYYVSQKLLFGCESFRKKITVQVDPVPVTSFTINTHSACEKDNFFSCVSTSTNLKSPSYLWDFGNGDALSMKDSVTYIYPTYGNYTISLKITNGPVCNRIATERITVVPKPVAAFNYPAIVCQNQTNLVIKDQSTVPNQLSKIVQWTG